LSRKDIQLENASIVQIIKIIDASNEPGSDEDTNCRDFLKNFDCLKYLMSTTINYTKMKVMLVANGQY